MARKADAVWSHLYVASKRGEFIEVESRIAMTKVWGLGKDETGPA